MGEGRKEGREEGSKLTSWSFHRSFFKDLLDHSDPILRDDSVSYFHLPDGIKPTRTGR